MQIEKLADAVRLAAKLRLAIGLGGGLGFRALREVLEARRRWSGSRSGVPRSRARCWWASTAASAICRRQIA